MFKRAVLTAPSYNDKPGAKRAKISKEPPCHEVWLVTTHHAIVGDKAAFSELPRVCGSESVAHIGQCQALLIWLEERNLIDSVEEGNRRFPRHFRALNEPNVMENPFSVIPEHRNNAVLLQSMVNTVTQNEVSVTIHRSHIYRRL